MSGTTQGFSFVKTEDFENEVGEEAELDSGRKPRAEDGNNRHGSAIRPAARIKRVYLKTCRSPSMPTIKTSQRFERRNATVQNGTAAIVVTVASKSAARKRTKSVIRSPGNARRSSSEESPTPRSKRTRARIPQSSATCSQCIKNTGQCFGGGLRTSRNSGS